MKMIGLLGGTFDPVHKGHLSIAKQAINMLALDELRFIPLNIPPHRQPTIASAQQRLAMLELALEDQVEMIIDTRELENNAISYTIVTLQSLRRDFPETSLILLLGDDAFAKIDSWKNWQQLLDYAHIVTIKRKGDSEEFIPYTVRTWMNNYSINNSEQLHETNHGQIYRLEIEPVATSSTQIRHHLQHNLPVTELLPARVIDYIHAQHLYQS